MPMLGLARLISRKDLLHHLYELAGASYLRQFVLGCHEHHASRTRPRVAALQAKRTAGPDLSSAYQQTAFWDGVAIATFSLWVHLLSKAKFELNKHDTPIPPRAETIRRIP
ncbi:hypothetical protein LTR37_003822 [Vermiconidia calcicola]|uniref:Uncharacterized protein n=1 Tax=Vermiconidia calcicola TaxID=1690605 RepID=A0ACC3NPB1_9PEZI|nr:hypothetical protein LTR37_003822 [Vermiconidia calcicola]